MQSSNDLLLMPLKTVEPDKVSCLAGVFNNTTNSYKMVWFMAILALIKQTNERRIEIDSILFESLRIAWSPANLFKLSFGPQDQLPRIILNLNETFNLGNSIENYEFRTLREMGILDHLQFLRKYVPARFLTPWFEQELRGISDQLKNSRIISLSLESQKSFNCCPYSFSEDKKAIIINESWWRFFEKHIGIVESFAKFNFALYLQSKNPNVPGVLNKLTAPLCRNLSPATRIWKKFQAHCKVTNSRDFFDVFSGEPILGDFSMDHFLPWNYVAHDQFWNLAPVDKIVNSAKGDRVPNLKIYLPKFSKIHKSLINYYSQIGALPKLFEEYATVFQISAETLPKLTLEELSGRFEMIFSPQVTIATNMGFRADWQYNKNLS